MSATKKVSITASGFKPDSVSVKAGGTVSFTNDTDAPMSVTFDAPIPPGAPKAPIAVGATCDVTFATAGSFTFSDDATNTGSVTVS